VQLALLHLTSLVLAPADHLKLTFPLCWTVCQIAWAMIDGKEMLKSSFYDDESNWKWARQTLEHGLDYLIKCHVSPGCFVAQVGPQMGSPDQFA
jgi:hypothetical protein